MTRNYLCFGYGFWGLSQRLRLNNQILVVWGVKQISLTCFNVGGSYFEHSLPHSGKSAKIRESNQGSGVCKEHYA